MRTQQQLAIGFVLGLCMFLGRGAWAEDDVFGGSASASASGSASGNTDNENPDKKEDKGDKGGGGGGLKLERPLLLTRHTMELGGEISIKPEIHIMHGDVDNKTEGGGYFTLSPHLGYFVIDKLELLFNFDLSLPFGYSGNLDVNVGFLGGARYFFDFNILALYVGGMVGPTWVIPDNPNDVIRDHFNINVMVGILVPMNRHIGIDLGMRMNTDIRVDGGDLADGEERTVISFPIGYLGVSGFFNFITGG
jgi:hypothetical protein